MIVFFRILVIGTIICFNVVNGNVDLSTNQPTRSSALYDSTTPSSKANDGDTGRTHPNQFHSACNAATYKTNVWWGVELKKTVTNPRVTFFARDCCQTNYNSALEVWIGNQWPSDLSNWVQNDAKKCADITSIEKSSTKQVTCEETGKYLFIRPSQSAGGTCMDFPEVRVEELAEAISTICTSMKKIQEADGYVYSC